MNTINPSTNDRFIKSGNFLLFFLAETMMFAIIPNITMGAFWVHRVDFLLIVEKVI